MQIRYIGPHDEIEIAATGQRVAHGAVVDVNDELGGSLCDQVEAWQPVSATAKTPKVEK